MKFKDKDGVVYEDICKAVFAYCHDRNCRNCALTEFKKDYIMSNCPSKALLDPAEAARLMGYEIVEDTVPESQLQGCHPDPPGMKGPPCGCPVCGRVESIEWDGETDVSRCKHCGWSNGAFTSKIKEASMDKPLKDWTLGEAQAYCAKMNDTCNGCWFLHDGECGLEAVPKDWDLTTPPRFTPEEVERANAILTLFPGADELEKTDTGHVRVGRNECIVSMLFDDLFPSILPGQTVKLSDIVGDSNTDHGKEVKT